VFGDTDYEPDETFVVDLSNPIGATIAGGEGKGTILNDDPALPSATTRPASMITFSSAKLKGKANPNGAPTTIYFEYGTTKRYGSVTAAQQIGDGTSYVPVSARVRGLAESTTYHFRLVATSAGGTRHGMDRSFTTLAAPRVTVCYHRRTLVVRQSQLRWYLRRGAYIGACRS
jgi:hypothetical protein